MKKVIIVGIDFSEGSEFALNYAIKIANQVTANILMIWVEKDKSASSLRSKNENDVEKKVKEKFEEIIRNKSEHLSGGKLMFKIRDGKVHKEIANQAKYHDAYLVIAGTHGTSGFEEFWIGSSAYKIVTSAPCPVITLRYGESLDRPVRKIVLPIDSTRQTRQKTPYAARLAYYFDAEIVILGLYSALGNAQKMLVNGYIDQTAKYLKENDVNYHVERRDAGNLTDEIIEFSREIDADLITVMTEQETTTANLLLGPYAQQLVNHSPVPVLSVRPRNLYDYLVN